MLGVLLPLLGCAQLSPEWANGSEKLRGNATMVTLGHSRPCRDIALVPVTPSLERDMMRAGAAGAQSYVPEVAFFPILRGSDYSRLSLAADCDADGGFAFAGLPDGDYYLVARVTWLHTRQRRGGYLVRRLRVHQSAEGVRIAMVEDDA